MPSSPKISIIVPVYGVEKYIEKCLKSIQMQTFTDFECIVVDDGSLDNSIQVGKSAVNGDDRFIFVSKPNGGLSSARNFGIKHATAHYICFVDSDDYLEQNYLQLLYQSITENNSDIAICGMNFVSENSVITHTFVSNIEKYYKEEDFLLLKKSISISACNKLYKKSLFKDIKFPEGLIYEDDFTTFKIIYQKKLSLVSECLYNYVSRDGSIVNSYNLNFLDSYSAIFSEYKQFSQKHGFFDIVKSSYEFGYLNRFVLRTIINFSRYSPNYEQDIEDFLHIVDPQIFNKKKIKQCYPIISPRRWILLLFHNSPKLSKYLLRFIHRPNILRVLYFLKSKIGR